MTWAAGHQLRNGKYVIEEVLGQGGFGITYKVLNTDSNEYVVIKTPVKHLKYDPDYDAFVQRFIKEGQRLAQFSQNPHPHIVRVWDFFREGEIPCMVMEFVPGENLFQLVRRRGALPEAVAVTCIHQVGQALSIIHQAGLVHRDAHPGNIIVRPDAKAILIDFGIAKGINPSTQTTTGGAWNESFAPYELRRGGREPTVDIYCLAATLYFAVTGQRPANSLDRKFHNAVLIAPKKLKPNLGKYLNQAILKGMALEAKDRPQSMQEWLDLLEESEDNISPALPKIRFPKANHKAVSFIRSVSWMRLSVILTEHVILGALFGMSSIEIGYEGLAQAVAVGLATAVNLTLAVCLAVVVAMLSIGGWVVLKILGAILIVYMTTIVTGAVVEALIGGETIVTTVVSAVIWACAVVLSEAWNTSEAWTGSIAVAWACAMTIDETKDKLLKSFKKSYTFLILTGTSLVGLGLGWLIGIVLQSSGFAFSTFGML